MAIKILCVALSPRETPKEAAVRMEQALYSEYAQGGSQLAVCPHPPRPASCPLPPSPSRHFQPRFARLLHAVLVTGVRCICISPCRLVCYCRGRGCRCLVDWGRPGGRSE